MAFGKVCYCSRCASCTPYACYRVLHVTHVAFNSLGISNLPCACRQQQAIACLGNWRGKVGFSIQALLVLDFGSSPTPWSLALSLGSETVTDTVQMQRPQELGACSRRLLNKLGSTPHRNDNYTNRPYTHVYAGCTRTHKKTKTKRTALKSDIAKMGCQER